MRTRLLGAMALTLTAALASSQPESLAEFARRTATRQTYGMYMLGHKVGWVLSESRLGSYRGQPAAIAYEEDHLRMIMMGDTTTARGESTTYYALDGRGELLACEERSVEDGSVTTLSVERVPEGLEITRVSEGNRTVRIVAEVRDTLGESQELERWLARARPGDTFSDWDCDWSAGPVEIETLFTLRERVPPLTLLDTRQQGARGQAWLRPDGTAERLSLGAGVELRAEDEAVARQLDPPREMVGLLMVPTDRDLGEARRVRSLKLEIEGLGDFAVPQSQRQRLTGNVLELTEDAPESLGRPLGREERQKFLASTPELQVDDEMRALAVRLAPAREVRQRAGQLQKWVFDHLEKTGAKNAATSRDVLRNRAGDCTEHSLLFVALARAAGIPAREVGGLAYAGEGGFAWHAWAEFHDGHHWVTVDPTWNELPVDATHIKLNDDPHELSWINLIGQLKLKVLDVGYF